MNATEERIEPMSDVAIDLPNGQTVGSFQEAESAGYPIACQWFAGCANTATHAEPHPVLTAVPTCDMCAARIDG